MTITARHALVTGGSRGIGRGIALTLAERSWQSWVGMGAAKSALEVLCRYFAVALAPRGSTVNTISPGWIEDSVLTADKCCHAR